MKRVISVLLVVLMLVSLCAFNAFAGSSDYSLTGAEVNDTSADATVEIPLSYAADCTYYSLQATWTVDAPLTLTALTAGGTASPMENDPATGHVVWMDTSFLGFDVAAGAPVWTATVTVPAGTADGEYSVKLHIDSFLYRYEDATIRKLVISLPEYDARIYQLLSGLWKLMDVPESAIEITSHLDSGLFYIFNQEQGLWINSVALYDYNADGLDYYRIDTSRNKKPEIITVTHEDYSSQMSMAKYGNDTYQMDADFARIAEYELKKAYISSVYLTGVAFNSKWMKKSTAVLCQGRRVFVGQNIYTKGACYRAVGGDYRDFYDRFFIETKENVLFDVGLSLDDGGEKNSFYPIVSGGKQWYNIRGKINVILDDTDSITLVYRSRHTEAEKREVVKIHGIPKRPNKTTKLSLEVEFENPTDGAVIIRDLGFGKLFPTTNKIYRKEFSIKWDE